MTAASTRLYFGAHREGDLRSLQPKENVDEMKMMSLVCNEEEVKWLDTASYVSSKSNHKLESLFIQTEKMEKFNELKKQHAVVKNKLIALDQTRNPINFNREIYDQSFHTTENLMLDMTKPLGKPKKPKQKKQNGKMLRRQRQAKKA